MEIKPIGNKILIKRYYDDYKSTYETNSGILIKQFEESRHKGRVSIGEIISMGKYFHDKTGTLMETKSLFKEGDRVLYYYPSQKIIQLDGEEFCFIRAEDIEMIIDSNKKIRLGR